MEPAGDACGPGVAYGATYGVGELYGVGVAYGAGVGSAETGKASASDVAMTSAPADNGADDRTVMKTPRW